MFEAGKKDCRSPSKMISLSFFSFFYLSGNFNLPPLPLGGGRRGRLCLSSDWPRLSKSRPPLTAPSLRSLSVNHRRPSGAQVATAAAALSEREEVRGDVGGCGRALLTASWPAVTDDVAIRGRGRSNEHLPCRRRRESNRGRFPPSTARPGPSVCVFTEGEVEPVRLPSGLIREETRFNTLNNVNAHERFNLPSCD